MFVLYWLALTMYHMNNYILNFTATTWINKYAFNMSYAAQHSLLLTDRAENATKLWVQITPADQHVSLTYHERLRLTVSNE